MEEHLATLTRDTEVQLKTSIEALEVASKARLSELSNRVAQLENELARRDQALQETKTDRSDLAELFHSLAGHLETPIRVADSNAAH